MNKIEQINSIRSALKKFSQKSGGAIGSKLLPKISKETGLDEIDIRPLLKEMNGNEIICKNWGLSSEPIGRVTFNIKSEVHPEKERWVRTLQEFNLSPVDIEHLSEIYSNTSELFDSEQIKLISGLVNLRLEQDKWFGETKFNVSAAFLLGSSKILGSLPKQPLIKFGIQIDKFKNSNSYLMMSGPSNPEVVILIENPQAFEKAVKTNIPNITWVTTYGYGLSKMKEDYGNQLFNILTNQLDEDIILLARTGTPSTLSSLMECSKIHFWGDLDPEGFKIYHSLKKSIPTLELSALYKPLFNKFKDNNHRFSNLVGKNGQQTSEVYLKYLSDILNEPENFQEYGLDQEIVTIEDIRQYAGEPLMKFTKII